MAEVIRGISNRDLGVSNFTAPVSSPTEVVRMIPQLNRASLQGLPVLSGRFIDLSAEDAFERFQRQAAGQQPPTRPDTLTLGQIVQMRHEAQQPILPPYLGSRIDIAA